jgi:hypothetical protein
MRSIGRYFQVVGQMDEDHGGDGHDDQVLGLEKNKGKSKKLKAKV